jgi:hypothetical protein
MSSKIIEIHKKFRRRVVSKTVEKTLHIMINAMPRCINVTILEL